MGWFRRRRDDSPARREDSSPQLAPLSQPSQGIQSSGTGETINIEVSTIPDAKQAIKQLKLKKKELAFKKKQINAEMKRIREQRRQEAARQGPMVRGGGSVGQFARALQRAQRDSTRREHAQRLAPLEDQKLVVESTVLEIDNAISYLQNWIAQKTTETKRSHHSEEVEGQLGFLGLADWWLATFTPEEREYIETKYQPIGIEPGTRPLTQREIALWNGRATQLLSGLASWFRAKEDRRIQERILAKAEQEGEPGSFDLHLVYS